MRHSTDKGMAPNTPRGGWRLEESAGEGATERRRRRE
uniref:Uncharacterized protein n=1 Tax=Arundo donax TaxID=35708 RepID=A0A0A9HKM6_ARUDO